MLSVFSRFIQKVQATMDSDSNFQFHDQFPIVDDSLNGICFNDIYIPEEIFLLIFSYLKPKEILNCSLVCKRWCNIAKSNALWQSIYNSAEYPKKAKLLPWYVFYCYFSTDNFKNLVRNGNGQERFNHWTIVMNGGDNFQIEDPPCGSDPLPAGVPEFNGCTSCFSTSFGSCFKVQIIPIEKKTLLRYIIQKYKPTLCVSEWYCGRFDCGCVYRLSIRCLPAGKNCTFDLEEIEEITRSLRSNKLEEERRSPYFYKSQKAFISQWTGKEWKKMELLIDDYPSNVNTIIFGHEGQDTQFWKGNYGSKMAGASVKFVFDSIEPTPDDLGENQETDSKNAPQDVRQ